MSSDISEDNPREPFITKESVHKTQFIPLKMINPASPEILERQYSELDRISNGLTGRFKFYDNLIVVMLVLMIIGVALSLVSIKGFINIFLIFVKCFKMYTYFLSWKSRRKDDVLLVRLVVDYLRIGLVFGGVISVRDSPKLYVCFSIL
jgi:hypothetical protein